MKLEEVLPKFRKGVAIRRANWHSEYTIKNDAKMQHSIQAISLAADDWEIVVQRMDFSEALLKMKAGYAVRLYFWDYSMPACSMCNPQFKEAPRSWLLSEDWIIDWAATEKLKGGAIT